MDRAEGAGLGVAVVGHVILFGLLSVGFLATPNPLKLETKPIDVSLVEDVAVEASSPNQDEAPAPAMAPDKGPIEEAPPPEPAAEAQPEPAPPVPQPKPEPKPVPPRKPAPVAKPQPPKPAAAPAKPAPVKAQPRQESKPAARPSQSRAGTNPTATAARPRGPRLSDDIIKGLTDTPAAGRNPSPRAPAVSASAVASIGDAIRRQVQPCADRITNPGPGANLITSKIRLQMKVDGTFAARPELRGQNGVNAENQRYSRRVAELAMSAMTACAPYKLPAELYEGGWKDIIINYKLPD